MALRVTGTFGSLRADPVIPGSDEAGRITMLAWLRPDAANRVMRVTLSNNGQPRIALNLGTGSSLQGRLQYNNDAGVAQPSCNATAMQGTVNGWTPLAISISPELAVGQIRFAGMRPGAFQNGSPGPTSFPTMREFRVLTVGREVAAVYQGDYAHVALWGAGLGDGELSALMGGENPLNIRRSALRHYWPLEHDGRNLAAPAAALYWTDNVGPGWVDGPRVAKPAVGRVYYRSSTAPSSVVGMAFAGSLAGATAAAAATREPQLVAMREAAFRGLQRTLAEAFPAMQLERNRRAPIDDREELPRLVLRDGGHEATNDDAAEEGAYTVSATVEAYAKGGDDMLLGETLNDLHARIVAALVGHEIAIDLDGRTTWPLEDALELDDAPASQAEYHIGALYLTLRFVLRWPIGTGPFSTI